MVEVLLNSPEARPIRQRLLGPGETMHAPHLLDLEVTQVMRRYQLAGRISPERAGEALRVYGDLRIQRYPHAPLLSRIWDLRHNLSAYDGCYVALAEALRAPLMTRDRALAASLRNLVEVEVF